MPDTDRSMTPVCASIFFWRQERTEDPNQGAQPKLLDCANKLEDAGMRITSRCLGRSVVVEVRPSSALAWVSLWASESNPSGVIYFITIYHPAWGGIAKDGSVESFDLLVAQLRREVEGLT